LEDVLLKVLPSLFPDFCATPSGARGEFYTKFRREADEYDEYFTNKYDEDLSTTLIFVSTFPTVTRPRIDTWWNIGRFILSCYNGFHHLYSRGLLAQPRI
jgi:hypothetical protein